MIINVMALAWSFITTTHYPFLCTTLKNKNENKTCLLLQEAFLNFP